MLVQVNSILPVAASSIPLDHARMGVLRRLTLEAQKQNRRARLAQLLDRHGAAEVGRLSDLDPSYLWQIAKGEGKSARNLSDANARKIETGVGLEEGWFDIDPANPDDEPEGFNKAPISPFETREGYVRFQLMDARGGAGPGVINPDYPEVLREVELAEWQVRQELGRVPSPARVKLLTVRGDSMSPRIRSGDVVFVDIQDRQPHDGGLFVVVLHGHALVKRLEIRTDGLHIVSLAAPDRPDIVPPNRMETLHIAGRVLGAIQLRKAEDL